MSFSKFRELGSGKDPEWFKSLLGNSPLLGRSEYEYISEVLRSFTEKIKSKPDVDIPSNRHMKKKLSVIKDNFEEVVKYLKKNSQSKYYFLENYAPWQSCRDLSILKLIGIARIVNDNSKESASTRCLGGTVSLAGGLMSLIPGLGALRLAGGVMMALGSLAAMGASFAEMEKLKEKIKEAEKVLLEDRERSEKLWSWMSDMTHIQEAYDTITSIDMNLKEIAEDLHACYKEKSPQPKMMIVIEQAVNKLKISNKIANDIIEVIGILVTCFMLYERYRPSFSVAFETYKFKRILSACNGVAIAKNVAAVVMAGKNPKLNPFLKCSLGLGIALDAINIIHAANDFDETSKEAIEIAKAAEKLQEEADIFEKVYDAVIRV